jgi:hypothetical protein
MPETNPGKTLIHHPPPKIAGFPSAISRFLIYNDSNAIIPDVKTVSKTKRNKPFSTNLPKISPDIQNATSSLK